MSKSTKASPTRKSQQKPKKPRPDFPLFPHATKRWCKKIRGQHHYFGRWDDPDAALQKYLDEKDDLYAGRTPRVASDGLTVADLANRFLTAKKQFLDLGEITLGTWRSYHEECETVVATFGKNRRVDDLASDDFARLRAVLSTGQNGKLCPSTIKNRLWRVISLFKYAHDSRLVDIPVHFGPDFKIPPKREFRKFRQSRGKRVFEAHELRAVLDSATQPLKTMILLACNGGLGQTDIANLPLSAIDFEDGWLDYPRPKTAIERRIPLWRESVESLQEAIAMRPVARESVDDDMCFLTCGGRRWTRYSDSEKRAWVDEIKKIFGKLLRELGINGKVDRNFYAIRHTFQTIAEESCDLTAVKHVMGHVDASMSGVYRERISDERLRAVVDVVHRWLFGED